MGSAQNGKFSYAFYPPKTSVDTTAKPLFILFHPAGSSGDDYIERWVPLLGKWGYVFAPTAGVETSYGSSEFEGKFREELQKFQNRFPIDPSRIILISESNGAIYGYRLLVTRPDLFKIAIFISGFLEDKTLAKLSTKKDEIKTKMLIVHGTNDEVFNFETAKKTASDLKAIGLNAELIEMQGMQHGADPFCEDEIEKWLEKEI